MTVDVLRVVPSVALCGASMALAAVAIGNLTRTEWTWWLVPLSIAVDGSHLFRAPVDENGRVLWSSRTSIFTDPEIPSHLLSSLAAAGLAAWGAYAGHRAAIIVGAGFVILGRALERNEEPRFERRTSRDAHRYARAPGAAGGTWSSAPHLCRTRAIATIVYRIQVAEHVAAVEKPDLPLEWEAPHHSAARLRSARRRRGSAPRSDALREQLGLKLEPGMVAVSMLVVRHAERPIPQ